MYMYRKKNLHPDVGVSVSKCQVVSILHKASALVQVNSALLLHTVPREHVIMHFKSAF